MSRTVLSLAAALALGAVPAAAQPSDLSEGWQIRADDQALQVGGDAGFVLPNVTVEDRNADQVGDRPYVIRATGFFNGVRYYAKAEVTIRNGELEEVTDASFQFTLEPPNLPATLRFHDCDQTLEPGQAVLCGVDALRSDGSIEDVTTDPGTAYISSDPSILSVDEAGIVTGVRPGTGFITASNDGVAAVKSFFVRSATVATTVEGFLLKPDDAPAAGITVTTTGGGAVSDPAGKFSIPLVLPAGQTVSLDALGQIGGQTFAGSKSGIEVMPEGVTDAGLLTLALQDGLAWSARAPLYDSLDGTGTYSVTFDGDRGVLVLSGLVRVRNEVHTWERDQAGVWRLRAVEPYYNTPNQGVQMAYDAGRQRVVRVTIALDEVAFIPVIRTDEWDGVAWSLRSTDGPTPPVDIFAGDAQAFGLAYDASRGVTYYVGNGEFWEWDGDAWTARPEGLPSARTALVRDTVRDRLVAFSVDSASLILSVWEFDGLTWSLRLVRNNILVLPFGAMSAVYDPVQEVTWLFVSNSFGGGLQERHRWDGNVLLLASQEAQSLNGVFPEFYFDSHAGFAMSYAGVRTVNSGRTATNVVRTLTNPAMTSEMLAPRSGPLIYDEARQRCMIVGSGNFNSPVDDWTWDGRTWTRQAPAVHPSNRVLHGLTYDPGRELVLLHGGQTATAMADTWTWDGTAWTQVATTGPAARWGHGLVFDRARNVAVLFGGQANASFPVTYFGDTWEWDGTVWTQVANTGPSPRSRFAMAYDEARGVTVLVGGQGSTPFNGGTWEWDGSTWTQRPTPGSLASAIDVGMTYDPVRARCVTYFRLSGPNGQLLEWDGNDWTPRPVNGQILPTNSRFPSVAFDRDRGVLVFTSSNADAVHTWEISP